MPIDRTIWRELEQIARRLGTDNKSAGFPPAADDALWKLCQRECPPIRGVQLDDELLHAVRHAYHDGYRPYLINLTQTIRSLRRRGYFADVIRSDSRTTLVAGRWPHTGRDQDHWPVSVDPGWRHGPEAFATTDTAMVVAHRGGQQPQPVPPGTTAAQLAELVIDAIERDPDSCGGQVMPTAIADAIFDHSQIAPGAGTLSLMHDGEHGAATFQRQLAALVDDRLASRQGLERGVEFTVFSGDRDASMIRTHGLLTHHRAGSLVFSCGHRVAVAEVVSIHFHLLPGRCPAPAGRNAAA
jgi:hypothetical protein